MYLSNMADDESSGDASTKLTCASPKKEKTRKRCYYPIWLFLKMILGLLRARIRRSPHSLQPFLWRSVFILSVSALTLRSSQIHLDAAPLDVPLHSKETLSQCPAFHASHSLPHHYLQPTPPPTFNSQHTSASLPRSPCLYSRS